MLSRPLNPLNRTMSFPSGVSIVSGRSACTFSGTSASVLTQRIRHAGGKKPGKDSFRRVSRDLVPELTALADPDGDAGDGLPRRHPLQELVRHVPHKRARQDVIHVSRAALHFFAAIGDLVHDGVVVGKPGAVILGEAVSN